MLYKGNIVSLFRVLSIWPDTACVSIRPKTNSDQIKNEKEDVKILIFL